MQAIILQGQNALSDFRVAAIIQEARELRVPLDLERIRARQVYFVEARGPIRDDVMEKTLSLLSASGPFDMQGGFFVTPRKGTISPWSSKATDIFHNCGLGEHISRVEHGIYYQVQERGHRPVTFDNVQPLLPLLHDRMIEGVYHDVTDIFEHGEPAPIREVNILENGREALEKANIDWGLAISDEEIEYLYQTYSKMQRNPTDVELVMFGQVNSEHCRHKIFNAEWIVDGEKRDMSLFNMIRNTHKNFSGGVLSAYEDNSAVIEGFDDEWFEVDRTGSSQYRYNPDQLDIQIKVETHNHPTAISPFPGASTGVGGEIRDEGATGIGGRSKAGLAGFMVSNLRIPHFLQPWEKDFAEFPDRLATPLQIMIDGPLGGAAFGNEFGRPQLCGFFKTYEEAYNERYRGYHKPIMVAGGFGNIKRRHIEKHALEKGAAIIQIGGPAMRIGLGGGAASSMDTGSNAQNLDFDSVQRENAEMQRRCQEVIDACISLGDDNPIVSIHDIGAGGLSNGCPELVSETGGRFWLRKVHNEEKSMSPMEIWCCEAQERYVLAVKQENLERFLDLCKHERCPVAVIGEASGDGQLVLEDSHFKNKPIDIDLQVILGKPPRMLRDVQHLEENHPVLDLEDIRMHDAVERVLRLPAVANKTFLITITDRSVTGMVARDQMVGPYQTPISDVAVTTTSFKSTTGEAMAMGERSKIALVNAPASGRMAIGEALTNIAAANIGPIGNVKLSANWMAACTETGEDANLYDTVRAVGMDLCPKLGICIPVGKDSLSMRSTWIDSQKGQQHQIAPLSLVITAFAPVKDVRKTVTPELKKSDGSRLFLIDLGQGENRTGGASALAQVFNQVGSDHPDLRSPDEMVAFFNCIQQMVEEKLLLAYHDRSDGGLFACLAEMCIGARMGLWVDIQDLGFDPLRILFNEELGAVIQVAEEKLDRVKALFNEYKLDELVHEFGAPGAPEKHASELTDGATELGEAFMPHVLLVKRGENIIYSGRISVLARLWSETTYHMQNLRDNPLCAKEEYDNLLDENDPGIQYHVNYDPSENLAKDFMVNTGARPRMAILREQGINGQNEMAACFDRAGFESIDVHMTDLLEGRAMLDDFRGLVACGGFSYGDVLGAGSGWAKSILYHPSLRNMFRDFFHRDETFSLGVCNGCQMLAQLKDIIPGAEAWPAFTRNRSERFEARFVTLEFVKSPSVFFQGMEGSRLALPTAHGEGKADFGVTGDMNVMRDKGLFSARYVDNYGHPTERYPFNPNGSPEGVTAMCSEDGRATIMMPHPERVFRSCQLSWAPESIRRVEESPWLRMFQNARVFVG